MADEMMGIEKLRRTSTQTKINDCRICEASGIKIDCDEYCNDERGRSLAAIADQIEREHAEELAAAKRDLTDEAREAVERLRGMNGYEDRHANFNLLYLACFGHDAPMPTTDKEDFAAMRDRLIELIEHGGKRDADVAALRELADDMDKRAHGAYGKTFVNASMYAGLMHGLSKRIRKAVEGATVPDAESEAERACAALLEWRDQVAGMLGIDCGSMADEVQDAIMAELDKRLMPPGMEWPRWDDSKPISHYDTLEDATAICLALDGSCYSLHYDMPDGERVCLFDGSERIKRPEPEVLGADGKPIKVGETVYDGTGNRHLVVEVDTDRALVEFDGEPKRGWCASFITHTPPDTQERIDDDASMPPRRYYAAKIGHDVGLKDDEEVFTAVALDLLRRQRELDAKTMGGAR